MMEHGESQVNYKVRLSGVKRDRTIQKGILKCRKWTKYCGDFRSLKIRGCIRRINDP